MARAEGNRDNAVRWAMERASGSEDRLYELREEVEDLHSTATVRLIGERIVANLTDGSSIRGVLTDDHPAVVVLEHAEYLDGRQPEAFAGRAVIPRPHVRWLQALGADD